eukprot:6198619-Pleurochrysis_carterae.AAC.2
MATSGDGRRRARVSAHAAGCHRRDMAAQSMLETEGRARVRLLDDGSSPKRNIKVERASLRTRRDHAHCLQPSEHSNITNQREKNRGRGDAAEGRGPL